MQLAAIVFDKIVEQRVNIRVIAKLEENVHRTLRFVNVSCMEQAADFLAALSQNDFR